MLTYTNPRMKAVIDILPREIHRITAIFEVESHPKRGERGTRVTLNQRTGKLSAKIATKYVLKVRIVDGSDGGMYLAMLTNSRYVIIRQPDMLFDAETIRAGDERWPDVLALFDDNITTRRT